MFFRDSVFGLSFTIGFALASLQWELAVLVVPEQHIPMLARVL
jgi:hypothetical protein